MTIHAESSTGSKAMPNLPGTDAAAAVRDDVATDSRGETMLDGAGRTRREATSPIRSPSRPTDDHTTNPVEKAVEDMCAALCTGGSVDAVTNVATPMRITPRVRPTGPRRLDNAYP
jgi:hypothetical protein